MRQKIFEEFYWNISLDVQILIADIIVSYYITVIKITFYFLVPLSP